MKAKSLPMILTLAAFNLACDLRAQYTIDWSAIGGGGGTIAGGAYSLDGTVGQPDASSLVGGDYSIGDGFWAGVVSAPTVSITRAGAEAVLSWTGSGFVLQSAGDITGPWADLSPGASADGLLYRVNTTASARRAFFRLREGP